MSVDRECLKTFLLENGPDRAMIDIAMRHMEPFFVNAEGRQYELCPGTALKDEDVSRSIAQATGKDVKKIIFMSRKQPYPKPDWMAQEAHDTNLGACLRDSLGISLGVSLEVRFWDSQLYSLDDILWYCFKDSLWASLGASRWNSLVVCFSYYLGFTLAGDQKKADCLTLLIELLRHAIPIGEKKDEPGTWLVLCA